jgi:3-oxoacyl-[acyl-carrier protein] reductase
MLDGHYGRIVNIDSEVADLPPQVLEAHLATVPAGHMGTPDDIAHAVSFLASEDSGFITGQRIVVDGGRSLGS